MEKQELFWKKESESDQKWKDKLVLVSMQEIWEVALHQRHIGALVAGGRGANGKSIFWFLFNISFSIVQSRISLNLLWAPVCCLAFLKSPTNQIYEISDGPAKLSCGMKGQRNIYSVVHSSEVILQVLSFDQLPRRPYFWVVSELGNFLPWIARLLTFLFFRWKISFAISK